MATVPTKISTRLTTQLKRFQSILAAAKSRDVNESDTVILVTDLLADLFGYDKYTEITSEHAIRSTYCDLAIKIDGSVQLLIEVKAIGLDLKDPHARQAVDYAANQGVEWVALTNGIVWKVYRVTFTKPIGQAIVVDLDLLQLNARASSDLDLLFLLCREGIVRSLLPEYHLRRQAMSRFFLGAILLSAPLLEMVRRELRRLAPTIKVQTDEIKTALIQEVLKREVVEGEEANEARRKVQRAHTRIQRAKQAKSTSDEEPALVEPPTEGVIFVPTDRAEGASPA